MEKMDAIGNTIGLAILTEYMFSYVRDLGSSHTRVFSYSCFLILSYYHSSHYLVPDSPASLSNSLFSSLSYFILPPIQTCGLLNPSTEGR